MDDKNDNIFKHTTLNDITPEHYIDLKWIKYANLIFCPADVRLVVSDPSDDDEIRYMTTIFCLGYHATVPDPDQELFNFMDAMLAPRLIPKSQKVREDNE